MNGSRNVQSAGHVIYASGTAKRAASIASEELGQGAYFAQAVWMTIRRRSSDGIAAQPCPRRAGSRPACCALQLAESGIQLGQNIGSESFAGQQQSSSQQSSAPNTRGAFGYER